MNDIAPFRFYSRSHQVLLLGRRARSVSELFDGVREIPPASIYYHTHRYLQQHHYLSPEPPNDFAYWVTNILNLDHLGEALASVDIMSHTHIEDLRQAFLAMLSTYVTEGRHLTTAPPGEEFHFMACKTFVLPTQYEAHNLAEFAEYLGKVTLDTLYFHVFEAPLRLKREENDFSAWFVSLGKTDLAKKVAGFDPYTVTLERLRQRLIAAVNKYA
jgi:hypothetical protein